MMLWNLVLALHLVAMATWVGGMAYTLLVLRPSLAVLDPTARRALHGQTGRKFFLIVWHAMPLMLLTGWAMVFGVYGGFANLPITVNIMHVLGLVMAALFLVLFFGPWKQFRTAVGAEAAVEAAGRMRRLIGVNLVLGVLTVIVASLGHWPG
jgi:uncharacterized membrane protein